MSIYYRTAHLPITTTTTTTSDCMSDARPEARLSTTTTTTCCQALFASPIARASSLSFLRRLRHTMMPHRQHLQQHQCFTASVSGSASTSSFTDSSSSIDDFLEVAHKLADAAGEILMRFFRQPFDILDKEDLSPVTIADQTAEEAMRTLILKHFPNHAIFGEEHGLYLPKEDTDYIWVLDPIDGTKSFITGKPVFGILISLVHRGVPILGIIDQPVLHERWVGVQGRKTMLNNLEISTRQCNMLGSAYLYTTSPHLFAGEAEKSYTSLRQKVKFPLYGCDCYAFGLLAAGYVDLAVESGVKPYDFLALVPVVEGAGGIMTNWKGEQLRWWYTETDTSMEGIDIIAAGDTEVHKAALAILKGTKE